MVLAAIAFGIAWFLRANPSTLARVFRPILVVLGGIGIGGLLIFGVRFLPGLLPVSSRPIKLDGIGLWPRLCLILLRDAVSRARRGA